jgi:hypothetical protein
MTDEAFPEVACPLVARLPVLGVTTTFATNAPEVLRIARDTYGAWAALAREPALISPSAAIVKVIVRPNGGAAGDALGPDPVFRHHVLDRTRLRVEARDGVGVADTERRLSVAHVTPGLVARGPAFVEGMLEPLTLFLLGALDRQPLHAAAVMRDGVAILLAGPSGAGKSTVAYAAARAGFSVLADEPVYVQMHPRLRVWGRRSRLHLAVEARAFFPELAGLPPTRLQSGKTKLVIPGAGPDDDVRHAERVAICLLRRGDTAEEPALRPLSPAEVVAELTARLDPGFDLYQATIGERIAAVARGGAWSLHWSGGPAGAVPLLERVADELARRA